MVKDLWKFLRVAEFAEALNIKESTARAWILRHKVSYVRLNGRAVRIPASEVDRILSEGLIPARKDSHGR